MYANLCNRYILKLRSIDMKRENGVFRDEDGYIPEGNISRQEIGMKAVLKVCVIGQSICVSALEECYKLIQELGEDSSEDEDENESLEEGEEEESFTERESYY
jgi:hypothetical protein